MTRTRERALPYYRQLVSLRSILNEMRRLEWLTLRVSKMSRAAPPADACLEHFSPLLANLTRTQVAALRARLTEAIAAALVPDDLESRDERDAKKLRTGLIRWQEGGRRPWKLSPLEVSVHSMMRRVDAKIAHIAPGVEKALDFLEAYVALWPISSCDCLAELACLARYGRDVASHVDRVLAELRADYRRHQEDPRALTDAHRHIFWTSADFHEQEDCFRFLAFNERFRPSGFEQTAVAARRLVEWWVIEGGWWWDFRPQAREVRSGIDLALRLWALVDIPGTCQTMRSVLDLALRSLVQYQHTDGFWLSENAEERPRPSAEATAAAVCLIAAYGRRPVVRAALGRGARWLLGDQHHDGYWLERAADGPGEPSILATCLAIRGLLRTKAIDVRDPVQRGTQWLLNQQSAAGDWGGGESLVVPREETVLVLNTLWESTALLAMSQGRSGYLDVGLGLAERALEHLAQEDETSLQIAVVVAFQAAEAFLYSCLVTANQNVFNPGENETIGFARALARLEDHLRSTGDLRHGQVLEGRSGLERLKYLRDQVVHKAIVVHVSDARLAVHAGIDLIRLFCAKFHGFQPVNL